MITSERGGQLYVTRKDYNEISDYIQEKKKSGFFVVDFDRGNGIYSAILEKDCGISAQRIVFTKTFNEDDIIKKWWDNGYNISGLEHDGVDWIYIFSKYSNKYAQAFNYESKFPADAISERWDKGYSISKISYGEGIWVVIFTKDIDYHPGWATRAKLDLDKMNKWIEDGKIITDLVYGNETWAMTYGKHKLYTYQTLVISKTFPSEKINEKWDNGFDLTLCAYGDGNWVVAFSTKNKEQAIKFEKADEIVKQLELTNELKTAYSEKNYLKVIASFEDNQKLLNNEEEAVDSYLWSLWMNDGTEEKAYNLAKEYQATLNTERWLIIRGHYCKWKKWFDYALKNYEKCSEKYYNEVKKIFDDYQDLVKEKSYTEIIEYFESKLHLSVSQNNLDIGRSYCYALYQNNGTEYKALEKLEDYMQEFPEHKPFTSLAAYVCKYLGEQELDVNLLEKSLTYFRKIKEKEKISEVKAKISEVKQLVKANEKAQKTKEKEEIATKKLEEHQYKTTRGITFCKFCGRDSSWSRFSCDGRKHGHNYTAQKIDGEWKAICTKCAKDETWSKFSC